MGWVNDFYKLVAYIPEEEVNKGVAMVLDKIAETADKANAFCAILLLTAF